MMPPRSTVSRFCQSLLLACSTLLPVAAAADTFTLRIGAGHPATSIGYAVAARDFFVPETVKRVKERTGHELRWVELWGGSVAKLPEVMSATQRGVLDVGLISYSYDTSNLYLHSLGFYVPFGASSPVQAVKAMRAVYDEIPYFTEVFEKRFGQRFLALSVFADYGFGTNVNFKAFSDLNGKKIGLAGPNAPWVQDTGMTPVISNLNEAYSALQTGMYQAFMVFPSAYHGFKLQEVGKTFVNARLGAPAAIGMTINQRTWNRLPVEVRNIIAEVAREYELVSAQLEEDNNARALKALKDGGTQVVELSDADRAAWAKAVESVPKAAAREADKRGLPGTQAFQALFRHAKALGHTYPIDYNIE